MTDWRNCIRLRHVYLPLLLILIGLFACNPLNTHDDFWVHAAVGRWMWQHQEIPSHTLFLWSATEPWVAHSWLSELIFFGLATGDEFESYPWLIRTFTIVLVALSFTVLWFLWWHNRGISSLMLVLFALAIPASQDRFYPRAELFTAFFFCLLLVFLASWSKASAAGKGKGFSGKDKSRALGLLLLFIVWTNCHGGVVTGIVVLGVTVLCDLLQGRFDKRSRALAGLGLLTLVAACVANPSGIGYWRALLSIRSVVFAHLAEWRPLWNLDAFPAEEVLGQGFLLGAALLAWLANPQRRWANLAWLVLMAFSYASAVRFSWLLALTSLAVAGINAQALNSELLWRRIAASRNPSASRETALPPRALRWVVRAGILGWLVMNIFIRLMDVERMDLRFPTKLHEGGVQFVNDHGTGGRMLNDYGNSSYLQWCFGGHPPLFIDTLNAYPDQVFLDYWDMVLAKMNAGRLLDEYQINCVFLTVSQGPSVAELAGFLDQDPKWAKVYAGNDGMIWVRRTPENEPVLSAAKILTKKTFKEIELWKWIR